MIGGDKRVPVAHPRAYRFLLWVLVGAVALYLMALYESTSLPGPEHIVPDVLEAPVQGPTTAEPFEFEYEGLRYPVQPVAEYRLSGLVVSHNNVEGPLDFAHPEIEVNTRDLCVIWGDSAASGDYRDADYESTPFFCHATWYSENLRGDELSNNHLITDREDLRRALAQARIGDQIRFRGLLVNYQDPHYNGQWRNTSTTRTDDSGGACEIVFFTDFEILRPHARGWWRLRRVLPWIAMLAAIGLAVLMAQPVRR